MVGRFLSLKIEGASHARAMRFTLENFPEDFPIDLNSLAAFMERRAPGRDRLSTRRREPDRVEFLSGVVSCADHTVVTDGTPIRGLIRNLDANPRDYGAERTIPRPGHADFGQWIQFGRIPTGGGKNSGRLTAVLCAAGGLAKQYLASRGISVEAGCVEIAGKTKQHEMYDAVEAAREDGDSVGGVIACSVTDVPAGLGGPLEEGLESSISAALFAIPGLKGVRFGSRDVERMRGSEYNDAFLPIVGGVKTSTNRQGGILGGRTSGMPIEFEVALRPTPTVFKPQLSVDLKTMHPATCEMKGRHDPCIVLRAVPVVEAVTALAVADAMLADEAAHPRTCLTLTGNTEIENRAQWSRARRLFVDMVEVRVDFLKQRERAKVEPFPIPTIFTFRRRADGGAFDGDERVRYDFFTKLFGRLVKHRAEGRRFSPLWVDFEEGFGDERLVRLAHKAGVKIIRSLHSFSGPVRNLPARLRALSAAGDLAKLAFMPRSLADVSRLFTISSSPRSSLLPPRSSRSSLVIAMGSLGFATRVLASRLHAPWTYTSVGGVEGLGHVSPFELVRDYRFRSVSREATLFGVTGWPLKQTRSPELHNAAFLAEDEDAVMIPFPAKTAKEALTFMKAMKMRGLAVTIPHKETIMPLLDKIDPLAKKIGAVNTVSFENGRYVGYNTDIIGFAEALTAFAGAVKGRRVAVLGDGGAAQAVKAALKKLGAKFEVFHRKTPPPGFDLLVNATPVDPIPDYVFTGKELVYDLRYVPEVTPLMERAANAGCRVENGFSMLKAQAREQRRIWGV